MKLKHGIILLTLGFCTEFVGGMLRILHYPFAVNVGMIATTIKIVALILILYKLLNDPKFKELLNS